jgi:hypothetical protein
VKCGPYFVGYLRHKHGSSWDFSYISGDHAALGNLSPALDPEEALKESARRAAASIALNATLLTNDDRLLKLSRTNTKCTP